LIVLNYHRIGNADETPFDSGVFSATAEQLESQISYFKSRFHMATLEEVFAMIGGDVPRGTSVLITFDDGYLDNYTLAFPILRAQGVQGVFFLPTAFIGTGKLPWWDEIAYIVKHSVKERIRLEYPESTTFDLKGTGARRVSMQILRLFAQPAVKRKFAKYRGLQGAPTAVSWTGTKPARCRNTEWRSVRIPIAMRS
jgi:hypothetical protein